jgi:hypothetical protein
LIAIVIVSTPKLESAFGSVLIQAFGFSWMREAPKLVGSDIPILILSTQMTFNVDLGMDRIGKTLVSYLSARAELLEPTTRTSVARQRSPNRIRNSDSKNHRSTSRDRL